MVHIQLNINTDIEITTLVDLPKLKTLMESLKMKVNKSRLARDMGVDRRAIDRYLHGFEKKISRNDHQK